MDDVLHDIGIGCRRHAFEEIPGDALDLAGMTACLQHLAGTLGDLEAIKQNPFQVWSTVEDQREQCAMPAADVDERAHEEKSCA